MLHQGHAFTENLCRLSCFKNEKHIPERRPLLSETQHHDQTQQPDPQPPMQIPKTWSMISATWAIVINLFMKTSKLKTRWSLSLLNLFLQHRFSVLPLYTPLWTSMRCISSLSINLFCLCKSETFSWLCKDTNPTYPSLSLFQAVIYRQDCGADDGLRSTPECSSLMQLQCVELPCDTPPKSYNYSPTLFCLMKLGSKRRAGLSIIAHISIHARYSRTCLTSRLASHSQKVHLPFRATYG